MSASVRVLPASAQDRAASARQTAAIRSDELWSSSAASYILALFIAVQASYFLKRAIFLVAQPSQMAYYVVIGLPIPFLIAALVMTKAPQDGKTRLATLSLWFLITIGSVWTAVAGTGIETIGSIYIIAPPLCGYFLGITLRGRLPKPLVIAYMIAIIVSTIHGTIQFFFGMTPLETAWAAGTAGYSLQASKAILGTIGEGLRPFGYFPDTMTWNTFLAAAGVIVWIGRVQRLISARALYMTLAFCLTGMFIALSRNVWLQVAVMILAYALVRFRLLRSGPVFSIVTVVAFFAATTGAQYILDNYYVRYERFDDALENRYAEIGTLHDRAISYDLLTDAISRYPLVGEGFRAKTKGSRALSEVEWLDSHSMVVDGIVYFGAVGSLAYLVFLFSWFNQSSIALVSARDKRTRQVVMVGIAYVLGGIAEGQVSGLPSLPFEFYFIAGFISGIYLEAKGRGAFFGQTTARKPIRFSNPRLNPAARAPQNGVAV